MLDANNNVKVCDFGIAGMYFRNNTDPTSAGNVIIVGSPKYLSPEVITSNAPAHPSMDIWALGIILYKMLHGVYPFEADNRRDIFEKIKKGDFVFNPDIVDITSKCCISLIKLML